MYTDDNQRRAQCASVWKPPEWVTVIARAYLFWKKKSITSSLGESRHVRFLFSGVTRTFSDSLVLTQHITAINLMSVVRQEEAADAQTLHNKRAVKAKSGTTGTGPSSVFLLLSNSYHLKRKNSASSSVISAWSCFHASNILMIITSSWVTHTLCHSHLPLWSVCSIKSLNVLLHIDLCHVPTYLFLKKYIIPSASRTIDLLCVSCF